MPPIFEEDVRDSFERDVMFNFILVEFPEYKLFWEHYIGKKKKNISSVEVAETRNINKSSKLNDEQMAKLLIPF